MAFTGELEHLNIVDIIQLVHTTRKSGIFAVKGTKGESRIVFRNGYIVAANHIDGSVRIGTVLVKTGVITIDDLKQAFDVMKQAGANRLPLLSTLVQIGALKPDDALRGLKQLVEVTIVELMSWKQGTFTFDTDTIVARSEAEQDLEIDAQMALMDALRVFDERERDRSLGKDVPAFETLYVDVLPGEGAVEPTGAPSSVTADDLGLADLDQLEKVIPRPVSDLEIFDPVAIYRQKIMELLPGFSADEQEAFAAFLRKSADRKQAPDAAAKQSGKAVVLYSRDGLISHAIMSLCNDEGMLVFSTDDDKELDRMVSQCLVSARLPVIVIDAPGKADGGPSPESIAGLRKQVRAKFSAVPVLQFAPPQDNEFVLQSYRDGVRAVLPKPAKEDRRERYIKDTIGFLDAFRSYIRSFQHGQKDADIYGRKLKENIASLRSIMNPSDAALAVLAAVAEMFERAITLVVRGQELVGERAIGLSTDKSLGPTPADRLKVSLAKPSVFRDVIDKGRTFYGESADETVRAFFADIGKPRSPAFVMLPLVSDRKVLAVIYGDFGKNEAAPVRIDMLEILALQAGTVLEYALFRMQAAKGAPK